MALSHHKIIRIIIAGGGTGGHIFPAVAVANAIRKIQPEAAILFIGAKGKMEMEKVPKAGYDINGLTIAGFNRSNLLKNITLPLKMIKSFFQVRKIFNSFKPNVVFGVGGYSSFPVLRYAQSKHIPTFIHESNAFAGKANLWLAERASAIFVGTKGMEQFFPKEKILVTGNPIRQNIAHASITKASALMQFGLLPERKTVLIVGGSLGAASINKAIQLHLNLFAQNNLQLIWQTGKPNAAQYQEAAVSFSNVYVSSFIDDMSAAYKAADIVISRSGAMAVAEIALTAKACIFVPYPFAAEDHQTHNAQLLVDEGAAILIKDNEVLEKLPNSLIELMKDESKRLSMQDKIKLFAKEDADIIIAEHILKCI